LTTRLIASKYMSHPSLTHTLSLPLFAAPTDLWLFGWLSRVFGLSVRHGGHRRVGTSCHATQSSVGDDMWSAVHLIIIMY